MYINYYKSIDADYIIKIGGFFAYSIIYLATDNINYSSQVYYAV